MTFKRSNRPIRDELDVQASIILQDLLEANPATATDAGWHVSLTGAVWTEIYDPRLPERVTLVIAITPALFLLEVDSDTPGAPELAVCATLAGAQAIWEGYAS